MIERSEPIEKLADRVLASDVDHSSFGAVGQLPDRALHMTGVAGGDHDRSALAGRRLRACKPDPRMYLR